MFPIKFTINLFRSVHHNSQTNVKTHRLHHENSCRALWANDPPGGGGLKLARAGGPRAKYPLFHWDPGALAVLNRAWGACESLKTTTSKAWISLEHRAVTTTAHIFICLTQVPALRSERPSLWNATVCYFFAFSKREWSGLTECNGMHGNCSLSLEAGTDWCLGGLEVHFLAHEC